MELQGHVPFFTVQTLSQRDDWIQVDANGSVYVSDVRAKVSLTGRKPNQHFSIIRFVDSHQYLTYYTSYTFRCMNGAYSESQAIENLLSILDYSLADLLELLESVSFEDHGFGVQDAVVFGFQVSRLKENSHLVYNPWLNDPVSQRPSARSMGHN